jgi:2-polyprenyl-3-methyl-5-hydroxy-6-metoxy-1,4-benzoquinol methylase
MRFLAQRQREPEIMDDPHLDAARHQAALRGLARINWFSGSSRILWPPLRDLARKLAPRPLRALDLATASGDVPRRLWQKARQAGLRMDIDGCDMNPQAVQYAQQRAAKRADVRFFTRDAVNEPLPEDYDVLMTSLFLHHLETAVGVQLLRRMAAAARVMVLVNDLRRSPGHYLLAVAATRLLSRSPVVHVDGPRSVAAAFTLPEVRQLANDAGLAPIHLSRHWPYRFLLRWERPVSTSSTP